MLKSVGLPNFNHSFLRFLIYLYNHVTCKGLSFLLGYRSVIVSILWLNESVCGWWRFKIRFILTSTDPFLDVLHHCKIKNNYFHGNFWSMRSVCPSTKNKNTSNNFLILVFFLLSGIYFIKPTIFEEFVWVNLDLHWNSTLLSFSVMGVHIADIWG